MATPSGRVSSPASTGGAGTLFEQHVDAYWLAQLLVRGIPPILGDCSVAEVHLQTEHLGWHTDDVLIIGLTGAGAQRKMGRINTRMPGLLFRGGVWHIDKVIYGTRVCESTVTSDLREAEALLIRRLPAIGSKAVPAPLFSLNTRSGAKTSGLTSASESLWV